MWHNLKEVTKSGLKQVVDCLCMLQDELLLQEFVFRVLNEFSEADHQAPWVRSASLETLKEDCGNLLLNNLFVSLGVDEKNDA